MSRRSRDNINRAVPFRGAIPGEMARNARRKVERLPDRVCSLLPVIFALVVLSSGAKGQQPRGDLRLMWYNVENLMYPEDDTAAGDEEFTPEGLRHWTFTRYRRKLAMLAKVIVAAGDWDPPDLVGLCEVENAMVLEDLVVHPILAPYHYGYLHRESPDHRGMDVACLFRTGRFSIAGWSAIPPVSHETQGATRDMLHLWGTWGKKESLDLFLVHFISRFTGAGATAGYRRRQSAYLAFLADSVHRERPGSLMIMAGDFNDSWDGYSLEPLRGSLPGGDSIRNTCPAGDGYSYKYRGRWDGIDLCLAVDGKRKYRIGGSVFRPPFLLISDGSFGGRKPFRTYEGYSYAGGFSDHLPILVDISRPPFSIRSGP